VRVALFEHECDIHVVVQAASTARVGR
jgi:hypothetical protein